MIRLCKLTLYILLLSLPAYGQVNDDFNDGDYTQGVVWLADTATFEVDSGRLHSRCDIPGKHFSIATPSTLAHTATWEFAVRLDFNTSSTNYLDAVLISDSITLTGSFNGYLVRIGGTTDEVSLYRKQGNTLTKLIDGADKRTNYSRNLLRIFVSRDEQDIFTLKVDTTATGLHYNTEGAARDTVIQTGAYLGFVIAQSTSSFHRKHWIDDMIAAPIVPDTVPPRILKAQALSDQQIEVLFSEAVDTSACAAGAYWLDKGYGSPLAVKRDTLDPCRIYLYYIKELVSCPAYMLHISGISDTSGNVQAGDSLLFSYIIPQPFDVLIHEIMADEMPVRQLPPYEYIELYNASPYALDLEGWSLDDGGKPCIFPKVILPPDSFLLVCSPAAEAALSIYGPVAALGNFPSLNNEGDILNLRSSSGKLIHHIAYNDSWYRHAVKKEGGWSLEMIDKAYACLGADNWAASADPRGGTPGSRNSVTEEVSDEQPPQITGSYPTDKYTVVLSFSETLDSFFTQKHIRVKRQPGNVEPLVNIIGPAFDRVRLTFTDSMETGVIYRLYIDSVSDCRGNLLQQAYTDMAWPELLEPGDLVINELLFDPLPGGEDFVELYNASQKVVDLKGLRIANTGDDGMVKDAIELAPEGQLLFPGEYRAWGTAISQLRSDYQPPGTANLQYITTLPSWPDDQGRAILLDASLNELDRFDYNSDMHFPLLKDKEGVSLERIDPYIPADIPANWASAASTVSYATPGYRNSQFHLSQNNSGQVSVEPEIFSPDGDGLDDMLNIRYRLAETGFMGSIIIFDKSGRMVRHLLSNELLSQAGTFAWNGLDDLQAKVPAGIYVVWVELFNLKGKTLRYKLPCAAAYRF